MISTSTNVNARMRFLFDQVPVRGIHIRLDEVWQHIRGQKNYPKAIENALGQLLAAGVLLASNLKFEGDLILQVQGKGILKMLVVEASSEQTCRATARWDENAQVDDDMSLQSLLGEGGVFVMTIQAKDADPWQGVVALEGDSIADMLMRYMQQSEQLDTFIRLAADENTSSGLLIQRLPEENVEEDAWQTISALAETTSNEELLQLQAEEMLYRLFHEYPLRVFEAENIEFACTCSHEKVSNMLLLLGGEEIGNILAEEGSVEINCDFCQQKYVFDEEDAQKLFGVDLVAAVKKQ